MSFDYDLFVIGGGSGGVRAARVAAATGAKVALAEEYRMGGTCVIRGCVPKKLMVFASEFPSAIEDAQAYGRDVSSGDFDWTDFRTKMHAELARLEGIYRRLLDGSSVTAFDARATIKDEHTITLSTGEDITAKHILIAVGGRPVKPELANADLGITSNEIVLLEDLPKSILIIGGGYIASEFAGIMNGLGVKVSQWYRGEQILRGFDEEARNLVAEGMREKGVDLVTGAHVASLEKTDAGIFVKGTHGVDATFDVVMFATGRRPLTDNLGLDAAGVATGSSGQITVDKFSRTSVENIYAVGDVTKRVELTPVAIREGMAFVETVFNDNPTAVDHELIPSAIFTQPEMGTVGLSEEDAAMQEPIEVYSTSFCPMQTAFAEGQGKVLMKLVVSKATRVVLGCHIVAPHAGELIQLAGIAVKMGATKEQFDQTCAVHPTMSEELVTMKTPVRST